MKSELYKKIKEIDITKLDDQDKQELLRIFMVTQNPSIRDHIAFIFSDLHYDKAIPFIIQKINDKGIINNNGALIFALNDMNVKDYGISFKRIICEHGYEARLMAYGIVEKYAASISSEITNLA